MNHQSQMKYSWLKIVPAAVHNVVDKKQKMKDFYKIVAKKKICEITLCLAPHSDGPDFPYFLLTIWTEEAVGEEVSLSVRQSTEVEDLTLC